MRSPKGGSTYVSGCSRTPSIIFETCPFRRGTFSVFFCSVLGIHLLLPERGENSQIQRDNTVFIKKEGKRKAFHTGSNSSCCAHTHQHYKLYQELCKEANIPEHHWAIPHLIWKEMEEGQKDKDLKDKQQTLDGSIMKLLGSQVFTHKNLLHVVTQFVAIDDQVRLTIIITSIRPYSSTSHSQLQTKQHFEIV